VRRRFVEVLFEEAFQYVHGSEIPSTATMRGVRECF
jgi:hypothetical protein